MGISVFLTILLYSLLACSNIGQQTESIVVTQYHENGKIHRQIEIVDSVPHGLYRSYYPSGDLENESNYKNGLLEGTSKFFTPEGRLKNILAYKEGLVAGECIYFYANGNPLSKGTIVRKMKKGSHYQYFEQDSGKLEFIIDYAIVRGKQYVNSHRQFNLEGEMIDATPYPVLKEMKDSLKISLQASRFRDMRVVTGKFDKEFVIGDSLSLDTLMARSFEISLPLAGDTMRFIVDNYEIVKEEGSLVHFLSTPIFVEHIKE